jgi:hypothetical protein
MENYNNISGQRPEQSHDRGQDKVRTANRTNLDKDRTEVRRESGQ